MCENSYHEWELSNAATIIHAENQWAEENADRPTTSWYLSGINTWFLYLLNSSGSCIDLSHNTHMPYPIIVWNMLGFNHPENLNMEKKNPCGHVSNDLLKSHVYEKMHIKYILSSSILELICINSINWL